MTDSTQRRGPEPGAADLVAIRNRVAECEAALDASLDGLVDAIRHAADWRRIVQEHPLECAVGAATLGFLVTYRPELLGRSADTSVKMLMGLGAESLVQAAVHRYSAGSHPADQPG